MRSFPGNEANKLFLSAGPKWGVLGGAQTVETVYVEKVYVLFPLLSLRHPQILMGKSRKQQIHGCLSHWVRHLESPAGPLRGALYLGFSLPARRGRHESASCATRDRYSGAREPPNS